MKVDIYRKIDGSFICSYHFVEQIEVCDKYASLSLVVKGGDLCEIEMGAYSFDEISFRVYHEN